METNEQPRIKLKYVPERYSQMLVRNIWKKVFFYFKGAHNTSKVTCFFNIFKTQIFGGFISQLGKKAIVKVFISDDRGYLAVHFNYRTASERYLDAEL